jgi:hypothetical protein
LCRADVCSFLGIGNVTAASSSWAGCNRAGSAARRRLGRAPAGAAGEHVRLAHLCTFWQRACSGPANGADGGRRLRAAGLVVAAAGGGPCRGGPRPSALWLWSSSCWGGGALPGRRRPSPMNEASENPLCNHLSRWRWHHHLSLGGGGSCAGSKEGRVLGGTRSSELGGGPAPPRRRCRCRRSKTRATALPADPAAVVARLLVQRWNCPPIWLAEDPARAPRGRRPPVNTIHTHLGARISLHIHPGQPARPASIVPTPTGLAGSREGEQRA